MSNSEQACYLRFRGRVSGPFPFSRIKEMAASGLVSPIHEISADRTRWSSAGEIADLFPIPPSDVEVISAPADITGLERWFYIDANSQRVGPIARDELLSLFNSGVIGNESVVWRSGMDNWIPLADTGLVPQRAVSPQPERQQYAQQGELILTPDAPQGPMFLAPGIGKGIASMVLGILSVVFGCVSFFPYLMLIVGPLQLVMGILAIVFGGIGMKTQGRPFAITGLVCGIIGVSLILMVFIVVVSLVGLVAFDRSRW